MENQYSSMGLQDAWKTHVENHYRFWPRRRKVSEKNVRLEPFPKIHSASLGLQPTDQLITIGSCFAYSVLKWMNYIGFTSINQEYQDRYAHLPGEKWSNIYTPGVLLEFVTIAHEMYTTGKLSDRSLLLGLAPPKDGPKDHFYDLMFTIERDAKTQALGHIMERRKRYFGDFLARIFDADCVILTLGLIESWYDNKHQGYINRTPKLTELKNEPGRFEFRVVHYEENRRLLQQVLRLLQENGKANKKILFTVSPVPLLATFRSEDVITSNMYSKSQLRTLVEELRMAHADVWYFPSFEMVSYCNIQSLWTNDLRHIEPQYITQIMENFFSINFQAENFPFLALQTLAMKILVKLHSETTETPDNCERNLDVGKASVFPASLTVSELDECKKRIHEVVEKGIPKDHRDLLFLELVVAMNDGNDSARARKTLQQLAAQENIIREMKSALAGYGLKLREPDMVRQLAEPFVEQHDESWTFYYQVSLAYMQQNNTKRALEVLIRCISHPMKWVLSDHRSADYMAMGVFMSKQLKRPKWTFTFAKLALALRPNDMKMWEVMVGIMKTNRLRIFDVPDKVLQNVLQNQISPEVRQFLGQQFPS